MEEKNMSYNYDKVNELIEKAQGTDRTRRQYCLDANVSPASLLRILKKDYKASPETMKKLTSEKARPRGGVTFEELMVAGGYLEETQDERTIELMIDDVDGIISGIDKAIKKLSENNPGMDKSEKDRMLEYTSQLKQSLASGNNECDPDDKQARYREYKRKETEFENICMGSVYRRLAEKSIMFTVMNPNEARGRRYTPDMAIRYGNEMNLEWWFEFKTFPKRAEHMGDRTYTRHFAKSVLERFFFMAPCDNRKLTLVTDDEDIFGELIEYRGELAYFGDLSVAFFNQDSMSIESEIYLSHYPHTKAFDDILLV